MRIRKTQHNPSRMSVNERGGRPRTGASVDWVAKDEVGIAVGVTWFASTAPETGTIVGTKVEVGTAVGCVEFDRGLALIACLHASSSPSMSNP